MLLIQRFPNYQTTDSIFALMPGYGAPWSSDEGKQMDAIYFNMYSGLKSVSYNAMNTPAPMLAGMLYAVYGKNWQKLWDSLTSEYDPIDNYNILETIERSETNGRVIAKTGDLTSTVDETIKNTGTSSDSGSSSNDTTDSTKETGSTVSETEYGQKIVGSNDSDVYTFAFNSSDAVQTGTTDDSSSETHSGSDTTTTTPNTTTDYTSAVKGEFTNATVSESDSIRNNARADKTAENTNDDLTIKEDISRTRAGNVGQNTYQELISQEIELWKWNFFFSVFEDVDKFLTLSVHNPCEIVRYLNSVDYTGGNTL